MNSFMKKVDIDLIFKMSYMILGLLTFNSLVANGTPLKLVSYALTALGGVCVLIRLVNYKKYIKTKGLPLLILFLVSYVVSSIYTIKYGVVDNVKALIWLGMQFILLYAYDINQTKEKIKREATILGAVFVGYTFVFSLLSIGTFIWNYHYYRVVNHMATIIGFLWNRLWGLYSDPNRGAIYALISIIISAFALYKVKKIPLKVFLIANIIVEIIYMGLSDSRTGLVSSVVGLTFTAVMLYCRSERFESKKIRNKVLSASTVAVAMILTVVFALEGSIAIGNAYMVSVRNPNSVLYYWMDEDKRENRPVVKPDDEIDLENAVVGRPVEDLGQEGGGDVSNGRISIWISGLEVFTTTPILGTSFRNIIPYAQEHLPETFIVKNPFSMFSSMHNVFVDILVSQGLVGMAIFIAFMILMLYIIFKRIFSINKEDFYWCMAFLSIIACVFVSSFFYSEIVYINTANAVVFWIVLGYLINYIQKDEAK